MVRDHGTLVVGPLDPASAAVAERVAARAPRHAGARAGATPACRCARRAGSSASNFALAAGGGRGVPRARRAERRDGRGGRGRDDDPGPRRGGRRAPADRLRRRPQPGRGARAGASRSTSVFGERRPRVAVIGVLEDKDAAGMLRELLPRVDHAVYTRSANPRSLSPGDARVAGREARRPAVRGGRRPARRGGARARAGRPGRRRARHRLDLPDRRPGAGPIRTGVLRCSSG